MEGYYVENIDEYSDMISSLARYLESEVAVLLSPEEAGDLSRKAWTAFAALLPELPYIGGHDNSLTENLLGAAYEMGFYELLETKGMDLEEIGRINRRALAAYTRTKLTPEIREHLKTRVMTLDAMTKGAQLSDERRYPGDWVYRCIPPEEGDDFDFRIEYSSCAIVDLYRKKGRERYLPYICANDYAVFGEMGIFFERDRTIGNGASVCDFRFKVGGKSPRTVSKVGDLPEFMNDGSCPPDIVPPRGEAPGKR